MKFLENYFESKKHHFIKGGKLEKGYSLYEAIDTFLFTPDSVTKTTAHVRDGLDLKRTMITVVFAMIPAILMALYNTGLQANLVLASGKFQAIGWRHDLLLGMGLSHDPTNMLANFVYGALFFIPIFLACNITGGILEVIFATVRKHEINEGFLVTGWLIPLIVPPTIPLWQVAIGTAFGVVFAKEVFGGTGKNIFNPALMARAFLFFAYPAQISGEQPWVAVDGFSGATALSQAYTGGTAALEISWMDAFLGFQPGSMGETSELAILLGAAYLIYTGIGSWRIMLACLIGLVGMTLTFNAVGSETNAMFALPVHWHLVIGSFAFAAVFMATDPVSASMTNTGKWIYGILIGMIGVLIRVINPAYPEGWMLSILFMNAFAPTIDYYVMKANIKRRMPAMSESAGKTLIVATVLCGVCSVLVAGAVVILKPKQTFNADIDFKKNVLMSAGLLKPGIDVNEAFKEVEPIVINLETGKKAENIDPNIFNQSKADRDAQYINELGKREDIAGIKRISKLQKIYLVKKDGVLDQVVLHVYGKGLWSTMKGFLSLDKDAVTVRGFNYYSHAETPGLGGEIDNPKWISQWPGKKVYNEEMNPAIDVIKGNVDPDMRNAEYKIDGLSGATLTSVGVENTFQFWLSDNGYKKFLENVRNGEIQ